MSVVRVGSTGSYAEGWDFVFGSGKTQQRGAETKGRAAKGTKARAAKGKKTRKPAAPTAAKVSRKSETTARKVARKKKATKRA